MMQTGALCLAVLVVCLGCSGARETEPRTFVVTVFSLTNESWLKIADENDAARRGLWQSLDTGAKAGRVQRTVSAEMKLTADEPVEWSKGDEKDFVTSWNETDAREPKLVPDKKTRHFIGTRIRATLEPEPDDHFAPEVKLRISHDVTALVMKKFNYAAAAEGAQREVQAVEHPQFERIEWTGQISVPGNLKRLVASIFYPAPEGETAPAMRHVIFIHEKES